MTSQAPMCLFESGGSFCYREAVPGSNWCLVHPGGQAVPEGTPLPHVQYLGDKKLVARQDPDCLHRADHGGPCYTLADRVERGFGLSTCGRPGCGHTGIEHVMGTPPGVIRGGYHCHVCGCESWVEPWPAEENAVAIQGLGPDAPMVTEANGGRQSAIPFAYTSIDPVALSRVANIQRGGDAKYGRDNWRRLSLDDHINHALAHTYAFLAGNTDDDHLGHAATRLLFALAVHLRPDYFGRDHAESSD